MVNLLARLFIKDRDNIESPKVRNAYGSLCGVLGIILNIFLFAFKLFAGMLSGSISIMSDAFNNLTDAGSSLITLLGFRMASQKADKDHPFGHGRIEYVSGLIVSMIIILVGFELAKTSVEKIMAPEEVVFSGIAICILALSIATKAYMAVYNFRIGKKISSAAMMATGTDSLSDAVATSVVLLCIIVSKVFSVNIDAYCGLLVSVFILYSGIRSAKETVDPLLGTPPTRELIDRIQSIVFKNEGVKGIHDLIVHDYGPGRMMISLHAEVSADSDMLETHDMIDNIEKELREKLLCDAVIHMDPIVTDDESILEVKGKVESLVTCIDRRLTIHDFRMVKGTTHTNIIFDIVVPFDIDKSDSEIRHDVEVIVKSIDKSYFSVINIDRSYCS